MDNTNKTEYRCPITFVGNTIENNQSLNSLFLMPYNESYNGTYLHEMVENNVRNNILSKENNKEILLDRAAIYNRAEYNILINNIIAYLIMNITDLTINTSIRFLQKAFCKNPNNVIYFNGGMDSETIRTIVASAIENGITDIHPLLITNMESRDMTTAFVEFDKLADIIFAKVSALVFDAMITSTVEYHFRSGNIVDLYRNIYTECYGSDEDIDKKIDDPGFLYTFTTSCLRDICEGILSDYRMALSMITTTAASMWNNRNNDLNMDNYMDPNFNLNPRMLENDKFTVSGPFKLLEEK